MRINQVVKLSLNVVASLALTAFLVSCGDDGDDKKDDEADCDKPSEAESAGWVTKFTGDTVTVAFPEATAGSEYLIMPYALGNLKSVKGDDGSTVFNFKVEAAKGNVLGIVPLESDKLAIKGFTGSSTGNGMSEFELQHAKRSILNRFSPRKAGGQGEDFWQLVRKVDAEDQRQLGLRNNKESLVSHVSFERMLREREQVVRAAGNKMKKLALTAGECPADELAVPLLSGSGSGIQGIDISGATVVDGGDFCIVLVDQPTATTSDEIKTIFTELLKVYKTTVYNNAFAAQTGLTFKPVIAVIDFNDAAKWPTKLKSLYGVFAAEPTEDSELPMLFMPTTLSGVTDATVNKRTWYATLAHELQHANMNYFRIYASATKVEEIPALDEGLAHYFEDFFGFGPLGFNTFAGAFLKQWYNEYPMLKDGEAGDTNEGRGGAQNLWYYLASQKGGVTFTEGKPSGGAGVEFIRSAVQNSAQNGPEGLATAFGSDWTTAVGNFFGALAVDGGSNACKIPTRYRTQKVDDSVIDSTGTASAYGHSFNSADIVWDADRQLTALPKTIEDVPYYAPAPFIYKVVDVTAELKITRTDGGETEVMAEAVENVAVSVVKIK